MVSACRRRGPVAGDPVPRFHRTHAFGCSGVDQIPGLQVIELRQVGDDLADVPDQQRQVGRLLGLAIDLQVDRTGFEHAESLSGNDLGAHRGLLEVLAQVPRAALFACHQLQIAARHVEAAA